MVDPSRVAAQIVSGIGFLGAGLIITRRGAVHGLTTAAAVWETAAIGMASGAGLIVLAAVVTGLHFVVSVAYRPLSLRLSGSARRAVTVRLGYEEGRGVLRHVLETCSRRRWTVLSVTARDTAPSGIVDELADDTARHGESFGLVLVLRGTGVETAVADLAAIDGVWWVDQEDAEDE